MMWSQEPKNLRRYGLRLRRSLDDIVKSSPKLVHLLKSNLIKAARNFWGHRKAPDLWASAQQISVEGRKCPHEPKRGRERKWTGLRDLRGLKMLPSLSSAALAASWLHPPDPRAIQGLCFGLSYSLGPDKLSGFGSQPALPNPA